MRENLFYLFFCALFPRHELFGSLNGIQKSIQSPSAGLTLEFGTHTRRYADLPATGESFTGQTVAVLGSGNTAFETADALAPYTNFIHVWKGRREVPNYAQFTSWESRYVGSVRAINAALFDSVSTTLGHL